MASEMRVQCAWCGCPMKEGDPARPVSHGICPACDECLITQEIAEAFAEGARLRKAALLAALRAT